MNDAPHPGREDDVRRAAILTELLGQFEPGRCIDLGCGLGWYTRIPADLGWQATGIDARDRGWPPHGRCEFRQQDIREADLRGYDLVLCLGLFYHLTFEDQVALLNKCNGIPLILDTHVATARSVVPLQVATYAFGSWEFTGGLYAEGNHDATSGTLSSWGNARSFWPDQASLEGMLKVGILGGYSVVTPYEPWWAPDRTFWTCLP